ncbi:DNA alkylation repair protein [Labilithrix luteola]|nr:DNA alkylation repair protein [Labilithrix luteola]
MPSTRRAATTKLPANAKNTSSAELATTLAWLEQNGSKKAREGMARYAIPTDKAFGISVVTLRAHGKRLGRDHDLAHALWKTGYYEARLLAMFVADPSRLTANEMDRWCAEFDSWSLCDTACLHLFDRTPHAWPKVKEWARSSDEFVRRAAFALVASLAVHDKRAPDAPFREALVLVERAAKDPRNFVKKAVNWALRSIGKRNATLHAAAIDVAERLTAEADPTARWIGKDALRELRGDAVRRRLAKKVKAG